MAVPDYSHYSEYTQELIEGYRNAAIAQGQTEDQAVKISEEIIKQELNGRLNFAEDTETQVYNHRKGK